MRLLFAALTLTLLSQPAWSDARMIYNAKPTDSYSVNVLCIDGYKFVAANRVRSKAGVHQRTDEAWLSDLSLDQFYEEKDDVAVPAKC